MQYLVNLLHIQKFGILQNYAKSPARVCVFDMRVYTCTLYTQLQFAKYITRDSTLKTLKKYLSETKIFVSVAEYMRHIYICI